MVAKKNAMTPASDKVPDYIKKQQGDTARGTENVGADDVTFPRICQIQDLSTEHKKKEATYIDGAEPGMLFNNLTRELYGESVDFIPSFFRKEYLLWKIRKKGGGLNGVFVEELEAETTRLALDNPDDFEVVDTANMFGRVVNADGSTVECVLSMSKSKMKASRQLNSLIRLNGGDSFSRVYRISCVDDSSDSGDFYNFSVATVGFPTEDQYKAAEATYESVAAGNVKADYSEPGDDDSGDTEQKEY